LYGVGQVSFSTATNWSKKHSESKTWKWF